ncbi:HypC/HybG/HupF family hydrogenase formation chaperone [Pararhodospirillum photometricum]|uniref:Hydrogenase expression/formation protein hupH n=1 Tax=Pararhodospirillum photometricum DSM 122 TaxID=1150469 RepID=H6SN22_PARPM|nr:HypC/HybG/HupF family hydrogenase formation chaperone [Pararhodospirillum photometricum]CCG06898.1 Hydrogenase expression/formation protein hupH [Pararhodospirillum photometricum DSM 122]
MCLGVPLRVEQLEEDGAFGLARERGGSVQRLDLRLVAPVTAGQWVLSFAGAARSLLSDEEARQVADALEALEAVMRGENVDHLFADLVNREPTLPPGLLPPEPPPVAPRDSVRAVLAQVGAALRADVPLRLDLAALDPPAHALLGEILGAGDIAGTVSDDAGRVVTRLQESILPGVWRLEEEGRPVLEVGDCPGVVRREGQDGSALPLPPGDAGMARAVVSELAAAQERLGAQAVGEAPHTVVLSRQPLGQGDLAALAEALGPGRLTLQVRGSLPSRLVSTARRHVWQREHYHLDGRLFLHTLEVGDVPEAFRAYPEDRADAAQRLETLMDAALS